MINTIPPRIPFSGNTSSRKALTKRQEEVLTFLRNTREETGVMPSTREIQQHFGFASQTAAVDVIRALERKQVLKRLRGKARGIVLTSGVGAPATSSVVALPVLGHVAAGFAAGATQNHDEYIRVDTQAAGIDKPADCFALRVRGDSMTGAHILDGDYVILQANRTAKNGDIVAALIDGESTLKRLVIDGPRRWLHAENPAYPDLTPASELSVQGVMRGLVRGNTAQRENN